MHAFSEDLGFWWEVIRGGGGEEKHLIEGNM